MRSSIVASVLCASVVFSSAARADDPAAAQALFADAKKLMGEGKWTEACPKLEESQRLAPAVGTKFNLADCYEHTGKIASAWATFLSVAASTKNANQPAREKAARDRAALLEPKLPRIAIVVPPASRAPGLEVKRDGEVVGGGQWGEGMPIDPGPHAVTAAAPGKRGWKAQLEIDAVAGMTKVIVPPLDDEAAPVAPVVAQEAPEPRPREDAKRETVVRSGGNKTLGWVLVGTGGAAVAGGVVFWVLREGAASKLEGECGADGKACPVTSANDLANGKTYTALGIGLFAAGAVCLGAGAGVLLLGKSDARGEVHAGGAGSAEARLTPMAIGSGQGIGVSGVF